MSDEYVYIKPDQNLCIESWYWDNRKSIPPTATGLEDPVVQRLHATLGLEFIGKNFDIFGTTYVYKLVDKQLFMLAKIKLGI